MSHVKTVPSDTDVTVTASADLRHRCPFVNEVDFGRIHIAWRTVGATYELHSLAEYLRTFKDAELSHEEITDRIRDDLSVVREIEILSVETTWLTGGMEVRCSTSPTPAGALS